VATRVEEIPPDATSLDRLHENSQNWPVNKVSFYNHLGTLMLDVGGSDLARTLVEESRLAELANHGFIPKDQLHITVLNYANGNRILRSLRQFPTEERSTLLQDIEQTAISLDWSWRPSGQLHAFRRPGRNGGNLKLVMPVDCPRVVDFYDEVDSLLLGAQLARLPMHITVLKKPMDFRESPATSGVIDGFAVERPLSSLGHLALGY